MPDYAYARTCSLFTLSFFYTTLCHLLHHISTGLTFCWLRSGRDVTIVRTDNRMVLQGLGIQISEEDMCKGKLKGVQITAVANKR